MEAPPKKGQQDAADEFIAAAFDSGVISGVVRDRLADFAATRYERSDEVAKARAIALKMLRADPVGTAEAEAIRARIYTAIRSRDLHEISTAIESAEAFLASTERGSVVPPVTSAEAVARPSAEIPVAPVEPSRRVPPLETTPPPPPSLLPDDFRRMTEDLGRRLKGVWSTLSADFAANTLTYLGVLLSLVVIFMFFAFGYFGEAVQREYLRPPIFIAVPLFFLGVAWLLRSRTGLPAAANAVGMIGALTIPIMLSALFQDGYHLPPDIDGPARWSAYAVVGVVSAGIYLALTLRHPIYAYLVVPILWAVAGALGLYWRAGMSGPQLFTVLAAIIAGIAIAARGRETRLGRVLAVPTVRIGVVGAPFVFAVSLILAYNDAVQSGVPSPGLADLAWPGAIAAALLAAVLAVASGADFAWEGIGPKTRSDLSAVLRVLAYTAAGIALLLALSIEATPGWIGVAVAGYGLAVWLVDRLVGGAGEVPVWVARGAIVVGLALAVTEPAPAIVAWFAVALFTAARAVAPAALDRTAALLPVVDTPTARRAELWIPSFVVVGAGVARLVATVEIPYVFLVAATIAVACRALPERLRELRTFASVPAAAFGAAAAVTATVLQAERSAYSEEALGVGLAALALIAALTTFPWSWRLPFVTAASAGATILLLSALLEPGTYGAAMIDTGVLIGAGVLLVAASFVPAWRSWALPHGSVGHVLLYGSFLAAAQIEDALLLAVAVVVLVHATEAVAVERDAAPFIHDLAARVESPAVIRQLPGMISLAGLLPLTVLLGRQVPWILADDARVSILLGGLALGYAVAATFTRQPLHKGTAVVLGYGTAAASLVLAAPSQPLFLVALIAGAVSTFVLAMAIRQPSASVLSWVLVFGAVVVGSAEAGIADAHLYRPFLVAAIAVVVASSAITEWQRRRSATSWWVTLPGIVGAVALAVGVAGAVVDDQWLWAWASLAAAAMLTLTLAHRTGGLIVTVWAYGAIAYVDLLRDQIADDPVWLLPYAAGLVAISAILPGQRSWDFVSRPAPITQVSGLAVSAVAVAAAIVSGQPAAALAWTALIVASLSAIRREDAWLHAAVALLVAAGADAGRGWLTATLAVAAGVETAITELHRRRPEALGHAFVAAALWAASYAALMRWLEQPGETVVVVTLLGGIALSAGALGWWLARPNTALARRWLLPLATLGQAGMAGAGLYGSVNLIESDALLVWATVVGAEAAFVGVAGTVRRSAETIWLSAVLLAVSAWLFAEGIGFGFVTLMWLSGAIGVTLLILWALTESFDAQGRIDLWRWPALALAQGAIVGSALFAAAGLGIPEFFGALLALSAAEAVVFVPVAVARRSRWYALAAVGFVLAALAFFIEWQQLGSARVLLWLGAMAASAVLATVGGRYLQETHRLAVWIVPLHLASVVGAVLAIASADRLLAPDETRLVASVIAAAAGIDLLANRRSLQTLGSVDIIASLAFVIAAGLGVSTLDPERSWSIAVLLGVAALGLAASAIAGLVENEQRHGWVAAGGGLSGVALAATAYFFGPLSVEVGYVLIIAGGAFVAFSITARQLLAFQAGVLTWLAALLVLIEARWGLQFHATVVAVSVVLLSMLDIERYRRRREGLDSPPWLPAAEWAVMAAPLVLAAVEMVVTSLAYGLVLAAEGAGLIVWGGLTRVRRRAFMGLVAVTAAILLWTLIPLIRGVRGGLTGGWWLVIGAVVAVIFITAGALIEKYRTRIGRRLARWGEIVEAWD